MKNATFLIVISSLALLGLARPTSDVTVPVPEEKVVKVELLPVVAVKTEPREVLNPLPDFAQMTDVRQKKASFFQYLLPKVRNVNQQIMAERQQLQTWLAQAVLKPEEREQLRTLASRYKVKADSDADLLQELLHRVDAVPASLVLAQAANESGWGTSRFAREGNNLFGIWCFRAGCGLKPLQRTPGMIHEVARFDSVEDGLRHYVHTINTHTAYVALRDIRARARQQTAQPELLSDLGEDQLGRSMGEQLAEGLLAYSERGEEYVREIQAMIRVNELHRFTRHYHQSRA